MGSLPTFNPQHLHQADHRQKAYNAAEQRRESGDPLLNRAIAAPGRPARRSSRSRPRRRSRAAPGRVEQTLRRHRPVLRRPGDAAAATTPATPPTASLDLVHAIKVSDDDFFYNLGVLHQRRPVTHPNGGALQQWARQFGIGQPTGIDLPGEASGTLPAPRWRDGRNKLEAQCDNVTASPDRRCPTAAPASHAASSRRLRDRRRHRPPVVGRRQREPRGRPGRRPGDAAAAGGRLLGDRQRRHDRAPAHRARRSTTADGTVLQKIDPPPDAPPAHQPAVPATRSARACTRPPQSPGGTSADVMGNFPEQVYGKTGTAQYNGQQPTTPGTRASCRRRATSKPIVVVGHGRAGRLRRRRRRAGRAPDPVAVVLRQAGPVRRRDVDRPCERHDPDPARRASRPSRAPRLAAPCSTRCCCWPRSGWSACSLVTLQGATHGRGPSAVLRRAPGALRGDRGACSRS